MLDGSDISGLAPYRIIRLGVGRKFQIPTVFADLTIEENLSVALWSCRASRLDLLRPRLRRWASPMREEFTRRYPFLAAGRRKAAELSHGERQILELAMALLTEPRLLLLDEPCAGLSPEETASVIDVIRWAGRQLRIAIIVIEHDMSLVKELAETRLRAAQRCAPGAGRRRRDSREPRRAGGLRRRREMSEVRLAFDGVTGGYGTPRWSAM